VTAPRADGHATPLEVYRPQIAAGACPPLAVISPGAGGTADGYGYLARSLASAGYTAVVMGHQESGPAALRAGLASHGLGGGVRALVTDPAAETARLLDVGAALGWAQTQCRAPFRVLLGHSMGSSTVMLEAGASNAIGIPSPPAGQNRFDAYVALSPEGPGVVFGDRAWGSIRRPVLVLTGTRDQALEGGPEGRQVAWKELPGDPGRQCQWMGVIEGATHMNFAGVGFGVRRVEPLVTETTLAFLAGVRAGRCAAPPDRPGLTLSIK
jgi:predicted dienelactone hydrolase